jgi:hypothetical protein
MKITLGELKQLIKEQVEESSNDDYYEPSHHRKNVSKSEKSVLGHGRSPEKNILMKSSVSKRQWKS